MPSYPSLRRARLLDVLDHGAPGTHAPITLLQAPTGYGKTTLVRDWLGEREADDTPVLWTSLSTRPASPGAFWSCLERRARKLGLSDAGGEDEAVPVALEECLPPRLAYLLDRPAPVVVVIDAYENLCDLTGTIDKDLLRLAELAPRLRLVVTTRAATSLGDPEHRLRGTVSMLDEKELAFTLEETRALLRLTGVDEDTLAAAEQIHHESHGYPLAVRAASLPHLLPLHPVQGRGWDELIARDFRTQLGDAELVRFAALTSVPPYLDHALADELTRGLGGKSVDDLLKELEWHGYGQWGPYSRQAPVFRYAETFRDVMSADLEHADPGAYRRAAKIAAARLHRDGQYERAFVLAIRARAYALASTVYLSLLLTTVETYTTDRIDRDLKHLPHAVLNRYPMLAFARGVALFSNPATQASASRYFVQLAEQTGSDWRGQRPAIAFALRVAKSACLRYIGRYQEAATAATKALDYYRSVPTHDDPTMVELGPAGLRQLGYSLFQAGEFDAASRVVDQAIDEARLSWSRNYTAAYGVGFAALEGRTRDSARLATLIDPDAWPSTHAFDFVNALGRVGNSTRYLDALDFPAALREYDGCESFLDTAEFWPFIAWTRLYAQLAMGLTGEELRQIADAVDTRPLPPGIGDNFGTSMLRGLLAIGWLAEGMLGEAHEQLQQATGWPGQTAPARLLFHLIAGEADEALHGLPALEAAAGHTVRSTAALLTLGAAAASRLGNDAAAMTLLNRATALHQTHGVRAHLVFVPADDLTALRSLATRSGPSAMKYLDADLPGTLIRPTTPYGLLTPRELAVIEALAQNRRRADVAAALHVSPETVKSQLRSIYRKWQVNSRAEALERAVELGALKPLDTHGQS